MKISYRWLGRHVDLAGLTPQRVAEDLTLSTAEVEGLERFLPHLSDIVVGHVVKRDQHPDADKLSLCTVDVGGEVGGPETLGIVCGASNVAGGQKVAVARVGTRLPGDLVLKKARIRGVESQGMICSERELGLGDEHHGIWVLPEDAPVGKSVAEALGMEDWTIEIDNKSITHRPDLWGHRGIAAEIAAIERRALLPIDLSMPATASGAPFPVRVESKACPRYVALPIDLPADPRGSGAPGVPRRSPDWLRALLLAAGQRPIDLLVDLSNFVMLDLGQPNHLFDRGKLSPEGIVVRQARGGERMRTLDGAERALQPSDLLIGSGEAPVALAGVMGGEGSKVSERTRELLLEVATFHPASIRRTAQRLGLRTDSSARFEKSLDPTLPMQAAAHFARLLQAIEPGAKLPAPPTDAGEWKDPSLTIRLRGDRVRKLLGAEVPDAEIADILGRLRFQFSTAGPGELSVKVPSDRAAKDVTIEVDLVEEVGRIHRYGRIPERALTAVLAPPPRDEGWRRRMLVRAIQNRLSGAARFRETISYSFVPDELLSRLRLSGLRHVEVVNPAAEGVSKVRRSVLPSLLGLLDRARRERDDVRLFEVGKGYRPERSSERGEPEEVHQVALAWAGTPPGKDARHDAGRLARLQSTLEDLLVATGRAKPSWKACAAPPAWAHPARCLEAVLDGAAGPVAVLAALEPGIARALGLAGELASDCACAEVSIDALLAAPERAAAYRPIPRFPAVKVDVAAALPVETQAAALIAAIGKAGKELVTATELFDVYSGASLGPGRKSLAFHVTLCAPDRTLADQDVAKFLERAGREIAALGGELRRA